MNLEMVGGAMPTARVMASVAQINFTAESRSAALAAQRCTLMTVREFSLSRFRPRRPVRAFERRMVAPELHQQYAGPKIKGPTLSCKSLYLLPLLLAGRLGLELNVLCIDFIKNKITFNFFATQITTQYYRPASQTTGQSKRLLLDLLADHCCPPRSLGATSASGADRRPGVGQFSTRSNTQRKKIV